MPGERVGHDIYPREERRRHPVISEELIEEIAEKAANKALEKMETNLYQAVGKTFINKVVQFIGAIVIALGVFLYQKGFLKL